MDTVRKILALLTPPEKRQCIMLMGMILVMAALDVAGVASIMPFMAVLANPTLIEANPYLAAVYTHFGFADAQQYLLFLGLVVFALLLISLAFKALTTYAQMRFTLMREYTLGRRMIEGYLGQPYAWFLDRHSAELGKTVLSEVGNVIAGGLIPLMTIAAQGTVVLALLGLLLFVDPTLALTAFFGLGVAYALLFKVLGGLLGRVGHERFEANHSRYGAVNEAFNATKEIKVGGLETAYVEKFAKPAEAYALSQASASAIALLPRFALEAVAFGGLLAVVLYLIATKGGFGSALPIITLYAFAGYRLLPALQLIYASLTQLRFVAAPLDAIHLDLAACRTSADSVAPARPGHFNRAIALTDVSFAYPNASESALTGVNILIPANSTVGLVGSTGSGKTTIVDLLLGLLEPQSGLLAVDGVNIDAGNKRSWQRLIGYVPQQIFLIDDTVAANIAFGVPAQSVDHAAVMRAARIANLHDFVSQELPLAYDTPVGERGVRLSGGQRQRIGIARALYHQPRVLILDEATSALDNLTEQAVMDAVNALGHEITIVLIAHRLRTVRQCDQIYMLDKGRVVDQGTFDELTKSNAAFRAMAAQ